MATRQNVAPLTPESIASGSYILTATCREARGIVSAISGFLSDRDCDITEMSQYDDQNTGRYFSRVVFRSTEATRLNLDELQKSFCPVAQRFEMKWQMHHQERCPRVLVMVSKFDHCLEDLLYRTRTGELKMYITAVVSNHETLRGLAESNGLPFHYLPITPETKAAQERSLLQIIEMSSSELVILARYMQVLSDGLCNALMGRAINIHHSFLPGFKGAKPYQQAYDRGVKLIGATAHYVTADLDEGPIIEQVVGRIDHVYHPHDLVIAGRDCECLALSRAVRFHVEGRVFLNGNKTVVFR